jgi:hypothetical protein
MALIKGDNSYVTLAEANAYFNDRLDSEAWFVSTAQCTKALIAATSMLDQQDWEGLASTPDGALSWPRSGFWIDSSRRARLGFSAYTFVTSAETEQSLGRDIRLLRKATYELALHLLTNKDILNGSDSVKSIEAGSLKLTDIRAVSLIPRRIRKIIADMTKNKRFNSLGGF